MSLPTWAKVAIGVGVIVAAAAITVATGGAATGAAVAAVHCAAQGALVGAVTQGAIGAATGAVTGAVSHRISTGSWNGAGQAAIDGAATGFMTGTITGAVTGAVASPYCFVAGTTVLAASGLVVIEQIKSGDLVWAWDEETGDVALKEVVETYVNETDELVHIHVNGEEIIATPAHPFYSPVKGWTEAVRLRAGDILVLVNGEYVVVEKVQHEILESPVKVYNFQVADYHTYYVADGVLVHNTCVNKNTTTKWDLQKYSKGTQKVNFSGKSMTAHFDGKYYWLDDLAGHGTNGTSRYKVFAKSGKYLDWYADADVFGNFISGKHKGPAGLRLRL